MRSTMSAVSIAGICSLHAMMKLRNQLPLEKCPHCRVVKPALAMQWQGSSNSFVGDNPRVWGVYACSTCGGLVMACSPHHPDNEVTDVWPSFQSVPDSVPSRARAYLIQALDSLH